VPDTRVDKPWGHELIWAKTDRYVGKILHVRAGEALSLQYHRVKDETIMVLAGRLSFEFFAEGEAPHCSELGPGEPFHIPPGLRHRMVAIEDTDVLEVSTPELEDVLNHREIGCHRGRRWGFREVFGIPTLLNLPFVHLASRVKRAYEGEAAPRHEGWPAQREALQWLVDKGRDAIYALEETGIEIKPTAFQSYAIMDGNHRALALFILGDDKIRAQIKR
jgi:mannose-6-phosphate isomerase